MRALASPAPTLKESRHAYPLLRRRLQRKPRPGRIRRHPDRPRRNTDRDLSLSLDRRRDKPDRRARRLPPLLDLAAALASPASPATIRTDSQYAVKGVNEWLPNWKRNGWRNAQRKPVANEAISKAIDAKVLALDPKPALAWIKGHAGDRWNTVVDRLAVEASQRQPDFPSRSPPCLSKPAS